MDREVNLLGIDNPHASSFSFPSPNAGSVGQDNGRAILCNSNQALEGKEAEGPSIPVSSSDNSFPDLSNLGPARKRIQSTRFLDNPGVVSHEMDRMKSEISIIHRNQDKDYSDQTENSSQRKVLSWRIHMPYSHNHNQESNHPLIHFSLMNNELYIQLSDVLLNVLSLGESEDTAKSLLRVLCSQDAMDTIQLNGIDYVPLDATIMKPDFLNMKEDILHIESKIQDMSGCWAVSHDTIHQCIQQLHQFQRYVKTIMTLSFTQFCVSTPAADMPPNQQCSLDTILGNKSMFSHTKSNDSRDQNNEESMNNPDDDRDDDDDHDGDIVDTNMNGSVCNSLEICHFMDVFEKEKDNRNDKVSNLSLLEMKEQHSNSLVTNHWNNDLLQQSPLSPESVSCSASDTSSCHSQSLSHSHSHSHSHYDPLMSETMMNGTSQTTSFMSGGPCNSNISMPDSSELMHNIHQSQSLNQHKLDSLPSHEGDNTFQSIIAGMVQTPEWDSSSLQVIPHNLKRGKRCITCGSLCGNSSKRCSWCQASFDKRELNTLGDRPSLYVCHQSGCLKRFKYESLLRSHMRTHFGEKCYKCRICARSYASATGCRSHEESHTQEKRYMCQHSECSKKFRTSSQLKQHLLLHSNVFPFVCTFPGCDQKFRTKRMLEPHIRSHHNMASPHECTYCGKRYTHRSGLLNHLKLLHGQSQQLNDVHYNHSTSYNNPPMDASSLSFSLDGVAVPIHHDPSQMDASNHLHSPSMSDGAN